MERPSGRSLSLADHRGRLCYARSMSAAAPRTIVDKIWTDHVVTQDPGAPAVLAVDLHLVHEVTSPQAFSGLRARGIGVRRPGQTVATADHSIPTTTALAADPRRDGRRPGPPARGELRRVRHPAPRHRRPGAGHRPRHRTAARPDPAGDDHRVRRFAHEHARRVRGAGLRDRDERGRDGPRDPDAPPARPEDVRGPRRRPADAGGQCQGHHPGPDRPDRDRRRDRPRLRVHRRRDPRPDHGAADDRLQHEHRGRRPGRAHRPGRHDVRVPPRPAARAGRRRLGRRGRSLADASRPTTARRTTRRSPSTPTRSSRWSPTARTPGWASRSPAASPPRPTRPTRASVARSSARSSTWTSSRARRSSARRSTSSSSAAARTAGSATCAWRPASCATGTSPTACG